MVGMRFGQKTAKAVIEQVASNDQDLQSLDLTKSASFCMRAADNTLALCEALKKNTVIKTIVLRECEIIDAGCRALGEVLEVNHTIEDIDLQQNKITTHGAVALAEGLAKNQGVRTLNLMNQAQKVLGEDCLEKYIAMFDTNLTITKIMWKVDSRRTWELSKLITRNVEIQRRAAANNDYSDLLPKTLRGGAAPPPPLPVAAAAAPAKAAEPPQGNPGAAAAPVAPSPPLAPAVARVEVAAAPPAMPAKEEPPAGDDWQPVAETPPKTKPEEPEAAREPEEPNAPCGGTGEANLEDPATPEAAPGGTDFSPLSPARALAEPPTEEEPLAEAEPPAEVPAAAPAPVPAAAEEEEKQQED